MAMEAETHTPNPVVASHRRAFLSSHQKPHQSHGFEIKVVCVRIISSRLLESTIEITFLPRSSEAILRVNGVLAVPWKSVSMDLNRNRVDRLKSESIHVSTNSVRSVGSSLPFEIRVRGSCDPLVVGELKRSRGKEECSNWVMEFREGVGLNEGLVDVCIAGSSRGRPFLFTRVVEVKRSGGIDGSKGTISEERQDGVGDSDYKKGKEETFDEERELSWFSAGVRVGMGLGLGMSLGIGVGVGLAIRSYQGAVGALRSII